MPAANLDPGQRNPADAAPTDSYHPADPLRVHRGGTWRAGIVEAVSPRTATVTYRPTNAPGTAVDALTGPYVASRTDTGPQLDRADTPILTRLQSRLSQQTQPNPGRAGSGTGEPGLPTAGSLP